MTGSHSERPLAVVTGVGGGTGASVARRLHAGGYRLALLARNRERLARLAEDLPESSAHAFDLEDLDSLDRAMRSIRSNQGPARLIVHNAVRATFGQYDEHDPSELERNFRVSVTALHVLARFFLPGMINAGGGALVVTGNTAAHRGTPGFAMFAPVKAAQRIFAQALARRHGKDGVHVAYVTIDAKIKTPWTSHLHHGVPDEDFSMPDDIAEEIWHIAHQPRSVWSFDHSIRPFGEPF